MPQEIKTIRVWLPLRMGQVNCYLIRTGAGYLLIDTGSPSNRLEIERELESAGCRRGSLRLIVLTHGDFDHSGNAAYFRNKFDAKIAMHPGDAGMAGGNMFANRKTSNRILQRIIPLLFGFGKAERFAPDLLVEDGYDLSAHGLAAEVIAIPGHSSGSIGILTRQGDLFCGDLLENPGRPRFGAMIDDLAGAEASAERLSTLKIKTVYPGHGAPFRMEAFLQAPR